MIVAQLCNGVLDLRREVDVAAVVHAEHDGDYRGLVWEDVAAEALIDWPGGATRDAIAAETLIEELNLHVREARGCVELDPLGVVALLGDAISVEDYGVAVVEIERRGCMV